MTTLSMKSVRVDIFFFFEDHSTSLKVKEPDNMQSSGSINILRVLGSVCRQGWRWVSSGRWEVCSFKACFCRSNSI